MNVTLDQLLGSAGVSTSIGSTSVGQAPGSSLALASIGSVVGLYLGTALHHTIAIHSFMSYLAPPLDCSVVLLLSLLQDPPYMRED